MEGRKQPPAPGKKAIEAHYDRLSWWYARLWGQHIHHGYWEEDGPADAAQVRLIERLARAARIEAGAHVLDAGCGLGGSSLWLARELGCQVTGITLSGRQARMARTNVRRAGLADRVRIVHGDLEVCLVPQESLDVVWSIECTEHLEDKAGFIARAAGWLRPAGTMALCAWTRSEDDSPRHRELQEEICRGFLCPSLASAAEYRAWMEQAGLRLDEEADLSARTSRTWEICLERTRGPWIRGIALFLGAGTRRFLESFEVMLEAYRTRALRYGLLVARKPS